MNPTHIIVLVYLWFMARNLYLDLQPIARSKRLLAFFEGAVTCSKCLGFWLTLLLTWDIVAATAVSMFFGVLSYFYPLNAHPNK